MVDERDVELSFGRSACAGHDAAGAYCQFCCEGLYAAAIGKMRPDDAADPTMKPGVADAPVVTEAFQGPRKILVRPQPQHESAAGGFGTGNLSGNWSEQLEIGLRIVLCDKG